MTVLLLLPVVLSLLVLAAHLFRAGVILLVLMVLVVLALVVVRRPWAARVVQAVLVLGAVEWVATLVHLARARLDASEPVLRLVVILAAVAALTAGSALVFRTERIRTVYRLGRARGERGV